MVTVSSNPYPVAKMIAIVAEYYRFSYADITGNCRLKPVSDARHMALYLVNTFRPDLSLGAAALYFKKTHGSVFWAAKKIRRHIDAGSELGLQALELSELLKNG